MIPVALVVLCAAYAVGSLSLVPHARSSGEAAWRSAAAAVLPAVVALVYAAA